jgi:hypothetical protein
MLRYIAHVSRFIRPHELRSYEVFLISGGFTAEAVSPDTRRSR